MDTELKARLTSALFGAPLVNNAFRGILVEAMLSQVLEPTWLWCSADWASHDFENADGIKLEVKQSTALQSWHEPGLRPNSGNFDIRARTGRYEGARWIQEAGRAAHIYVFGWHGITKEKIADHRRADQWQFYVLGSADLPAQKSIALSRLATLTEPIEIAQVVDRIASILGEGP